jgi:hypothetical protein
MKVRAGLVANSSSTSFSVVGILKERQEILDAFGVEDEWDIEEEFGLRIGGAQNPDTVWDHKKALIYVGLPWNEMGNDETKAEFYERIKKELEPYFGEDVKVSHHSGGWYNG